MTWVYWVYVTDEAKYTQRFGPFTTALEALYMGSDRMGRKSKRGARGVRFFIDRVDESGCYDTEWATINGQLSERARNHAEDFS